jgi:hypothetical protein
MASVSGGFFLALIVPIVTSFTLSRTHHSLDVHVHASPTLTTDTPPIANITPPRLIPRVDLKRPVRYIRQSQRCHKSIRAERRFACPPHRIDRLSQQRARTPVHQSPKHMGPLWPTSAQATSIVLLKTRLQPPVLATVPWIRETMWHPDPSPEGPCSAPLRRSARLGDASSAAT